MEPIAMQNLVHVSNYYDQSVCAEMWETLLKYVASVEANPIDGLKVKEYSLGGLDGPENLKTYRSWRRDRSFLKENFINGLKVCESQVDAKYSLSRLFRDRKIKFQGFNRLENEEFDELFRICHWKRSFSFRFSDTYHRIRHGITLRFRYPLKFGSAECFIMALDRFNFFRPETRFSFSDNLNYLSFRLN